MVWFTKFLDSENKAMARFSIVSFVAFLLIFITRMQATDLFYNDIEAKSASLRYVVSAKSADNQKKAERNAFQASFVYSCKDTVSGKVLWTRQQPMNPPSKPGEQAWPKEGSPVSIFISDAGSTVIYTGWEELIVIDSSGKEMGKLNVLEDMLTQQENETYVEETSAGPMWGGLSRWYFVHAETRELFIIRPWWGRRLFIDVATGRIQRETEALTKVALQAEKDYVMKILQNVVEGKIERCKCCDGPHEAAMAAYLAGVLKIKEAIPGLRKLESDSSIGSATIGGFDEIPEGQIDPHCYSTYSTRQSIHVALRRLGEKPGPLPCTQFMTHHKEYKQRKPYVRKPVDGNRHTNAAKLANGMSPEQVIDLLDCPDAIPQRTWQYDIDADEPYTLAINWSDERKIQKIEIIRPALWQKPGERDLGF